MPASSAIALIVNPQAQGGRLGRRFGALAAALRPLLGEFTTLFTTGPGHGVKRCHEALKAGAQLLIAVGGDGTVSEVITGLMEAGAGPASGVAFAFLPCGTGRDLGRSFTTSMEPLVAARALRDATPRAVDVGQLDYTTLDDQPARRYFINVASFGLSGLGDQLVNRSRKPLGARATYLLAAVSASLRYRNAPVALRLDDGREQEQRIYTVAIANGRYFGGGMMIAPAARPDDGLLDVVTLGDLTFFEALQLSRVIYKGGHVGRPKIQVAQARAVAARPLDGTTPVLLDVDGENPGKLPATFRLLPRALLLRA